MDSPAGGSQGSCRKNLWRFNDIKQKSISLLRLTDDRDGAQERRLQYMSSYGNLKSRYLPQNDAILPQTPTGSHQTPEYLRFCSLPVAPTPLQPIPEYKISPVESGYTHNAAESEELQDIVIGFCDSEQDTPTKSRAELPCVVEAASASVAQPLLQRESYRLKLSNLPNRRRRRLFCLKHCTPRATTEYRPVFTYWITGFQIILFFISVIHYGFSPVGQSSKTLFTAHVTLPNQTRSSVCWSEPENYWLGPRHADLIRFGARYPPCMRYDSHLYEQIVRIQRIEDQSSGCCLFSHGTKCYQTQKQYCAGPDFKWLKHSTENYTPSLHISLPPTGEAGRQAITGSTDFDQVPRNTLGPVCGLDPDFCLSPRSSVVMPWSTTDVTQWPMCEHSRNVSSSETNAYHMTCEITARPCCLGIHGKCILTTREHCDFVHGFYNEKATLCSQVNCLEKTCGILPFWNGQYPDQFYRVLTALFIHEGLLQLIITVIIQMTFVRNLEKFIGWGRTMSVYLLSGCIGNLLSGYFVPYQIGTGPMASFVALGGLRSVIYFFYSNPLPTLLHGMYKNVFLLLCFFLCGFLPWVDNFANLGGLISGVLCSFVLLPYPRLCSSILPELDGFSKGSGPSPSTQCPCPSTPRSNPSNDPKTAEALCSGRHRVPVELICFGLWLLLAVALFCLFYLTGVLRCDWCSYFTCVPLTPNLCDPFRARIDRSSACITQTW